MPYNKKLAESVYNYKAKHIKRVPFDMQIEDYEKLKAAAESAGEPVNRYIKNAIAQRMEREAPGE